MCNIMRNAHCNKLERAFLNVSVLLYGLFQHHYISTNVTIPDNICEGTLYLSS